MTQHGEAFGPESLLVNMLSALGFRFVSGNLTYTRFVDKHGHEAEITRHSGNVFRAKWGPT